MTLLALASAVPTAAAAQGGIDRSFGHGGVLHPHFSTGAFTGGFAGEMAVAADGKLYFGSRGTVCAETCVGGGFVVRTFPDGRRLDRSWGQGKGYVSVPLYAELHAAPQGLVMADARVSQLFLSRYRSDGSLDRRFGPGGQVRVEYCNCSQPKLGFAANGEITGLMGWGLIPGVMVEDYWADFSWFQLAADGNNPLLGRGQTAPQIRGAYGAEEALVRPNGSALAVGHYCCEREDDLYLARISASGKLDLGFLRNAESDLASLGGRGKDAPYHVHAIIPRRRGTIDLLGSTAGNRGFAIRVLADGRLAQAFGRGGMKLLRWPISEAAADVHGRVFALGPRRDSEGIVGFWLNRTDRPMRFFSGGNGVVLPDWTAYGPHDLSMQRGRLPLIMQAGSAGGEFCRQACEEVTATPPTVIRFTAPDRR